MINLSLRARLTIGTACTLALAITFGLVAAYVVVHGELQDEIDRSLTSLAAGFAQRNKTAPKPPKLPAKLGTGESPPALGGAVGYVQFVTASGKLRLLPGEHLHLPVGEAIAVAAGKRDGFFTDVTVEGVRLRVDTVRVDSDIALQVARPLTELDNALNRIRLLFLLISFFAIAGAAAIGLAVASATLRPVRRLTDDAERIAATRDLRDRTDQRRSGELGRLATAFNTMLDALAGSISAQRQLVADASHELRTPLASARTNLEVLDRHSALPEEERQRILDEAIEELREMTHLIDELVELAQGDAQAFEMRITRLDLLVEDVVAAAERRSGTKIWLAATPTFVNGAPEALTRAIANLVDNALKWSPAEAPLAVEVADGTISVRDHGPGVEAEDVPRLFDRFYRAAAARTLPGSGLGLAIVKQIAEAHGGIVTYEPALEGGSIFTLRLPALQIDPSMSVSAEPPVLH